MKRYELRRAALSHALLLILAAAAFFLLRLVPLPQP